MWGETQLHQPDGWGSWGRVARSPYAPLGPIGMVWDELLGGHAEMRQIVVHAANISHATQGSLMGKAEPSEHLREIEG